SGSVGFDIYNRETAVIKSFEFKKLPANLTIKVPNGHYLMVEPRSSVLFKFGLLVVGGTIDQDYCGENDEIHITVINMTKKSVKLEKGTRIAQGIFSKISKVDFSEVPKMSAQSRGGFGTTGH
ncbi:MAG: dUTP diphosphatase, partial [bacterium]|nr:dUTP diphosphatase [bacterium]